jgi:hypothetical protein
MELVLNARCDGRTKRIFVQEIVQIVRIRTRKAITFINVRNDLFDEEAELDDRAAGIRIHVRLGKTSEVREGRVLGSDELEVL